MKSKYLFPTWCSLVGCALSIPGFILGYLWTFKNFKIPGFGFKMRDNDDFFQSSVEDFTNELAIFLVIIGLVLIAFSKSKKEDELSAKLRLNSLYWSIMIYYSAYVIVLIINISVVEIPFVGSYMSEINLFTPLIIFILRYNYLKYANKESYLISSPKFLPHTPFKIIGIFLSIFGVFGFFYRVINDVLGFNRSNWDFVVYLLGAVGLLLWAFTKQKVEDEMTMQQRLESLQLSVYFNYAVILVATLFVYSLAYTLVLLFAQVSILLFFISRMEYVNFKNNRMLKKIEGGLNYEK